MPPSHAEANEILIVYSAVLCRQPNEDMQIIIAHFRPGRQRDVNRFEEAVIARLKHSHRHELMPRQIISRRVYRVVVMTKCLYNAYAMSQYLPRKKLSPI